MKISPDPSKRKKVVIIGGGFAGINLSLSLQNNKFFDVVLVDKNNYNFFPPLIYQVATGFLEISAISYPFRKLYRGKKNIHFRMGECQRIDSNTHTCYLNNGELTYDYLVLATGAVSNYFGNPNLQVNSIPMKTAHDALRMRNRLLQSLEQACISKDPAEKKKLLTIVVAGGGPTGVEVAGMLAELRKNIIHKEYPELKGVPSSIYLIDGAERLLMQMSSASAAETYIALSKLGVEIKLQTMVLDFRNGQVLLSNNEVIETRNLIWAAGVTIHPVNGLPVSSYGKGKRIQCDSFNRVMDVADVYAIGDNCIQYTDPFFPQGHPQLAQVAIQQGKNLARNLSALISGKKWRPFRYRDKGSMAIIGRSKAVVDLHNPQIHISGFTALLIWLFIHLVSLINYRNKLTTLYSWITAYLTKDQSLRMIIRPQNQGQLSKLPGETLADPATPGKEMNRRTGVPLLLK